MSEQPRDIIIVGGGLVGLSLAAALRRSRLSVAVIDAAPRPAASEPAPEPRAAGASLASGIEPRVSAINPASREFLERIGGWPQADATPFGEMHVYDSRGSGSISFDAASIGETALGHIVPNRAIQSALLSTLESSDVLIRDGVTIDRIEERDDGYALTTGDEILHANLLIGADGGNSIVRNACGIRSASWQYPQEAVVSTIQVEKPHGKAARQWFTSEGPLAFLPLENEQLCSIVWSSTDAAALMALDDESFCARLTNASERALGGVQAVDRRFSFPLRQSHALSYVQEHLALVGDAAHTIHPLAGQGANLGFADAEVLAEVLIDAWFAGESFESVAVLRRYQRRRQPLNVATAGVMEVFARLYQVDHPAVNWLRNVALRMADRETLPKSLLMRAASGR